LTDAATGLVWDHARWYDPGSAQFISVDPLVAQTEQPYAYADDNPVNLTDPSGEKWYDGIVNAWQTFWGSMTGQQVSAGGQSAVGSAGTALPSSGPGGGLGSEVPYDVLSVGQVAVAVAANPGFTSQQLLGQLLASSTSGHPQEAKLADQLLNSAGEQLQSGNAGTLGRWQRANEPTYSQWRLLYNQSHPTSCPFGNHTNY
jgi:hypothetical protein